MMFIPHFLQHLPRTVPYTSVQALLNILLRVPY